jgi:hypothetical protein
MHPMSPTLTEMVVAVTIEAKRAAQVPVDPGELERYARRVLRSYQAEGPRITAYLPELALKSVLALLKQHPLPPHSGSPLPQSRTSTEPMRAA